MILNLTQHQATASQAADGLIDLGQRDAERVRALLTFHSSPTGEEIRLKAMAIAEIAAAIAAEIADVCQPVSAMIGGAPYLMGPLERALAARGITPVYAFSERRSVDQLQPDGSVRKVSEFAHVGWVQAALD